MRSVIFIIPAKCISNGKQGERDKGLRIAITTLHIDGLKKPT